MNSQIWPEGPRVTRWLRLRLRSWRSGSAPFACVHRSARCGGSCRAAGLRGRLPVGGSCVRGTRAGLVVPSSGRVLRRDAAEPRTTCRRSATTCSRSARLTNRSMFGAGRGLRARGRLRTLRVRVGRRRPGLRPRLLRQRHRRGLPGAGGRDRPGPGAPRAAGDSTAASRARTPARRVRPEHRLRRAADRPGCAVRRGRLRGRRLRVLPGPRGLPLRAELRGPGPGPLAVRPAGGVREGERPTARSTSTGS